MAFKDMNAKNPRTVVIDTVTFYSFNDEIAFVEWMDRLPCISSHELIGDKIHLSMRPGRMSDDEIRDIIALFFRYDVDLRSLAWMANNNRKHWLFDKKKYWFAQMFAEDLG